MKYFYPVLFFWAAITTAQIPNGYYNSTNGLTGYALKTELSNIITNGYSERTYGELLTLYQTSDVDIYYENDGTVLDMYSERPSGPDSYSYTFNQNCGNVGNVEGICYNREHIFPQGFFNQALPMRSDAHHVIPTDGRVNGLRSNFPFGIVGGNPTPTSNGSKVGASITPGFSGTVFEPIDEFKGDIARALLYVATRYEDVSQYSGWGSATANNDPRDGSINRWYEQWYVDLLLDWHANDPVSQKEIDRNNSIYLYQNNRNPFVDNPQWVNQIWTSMATPSGSLFPTLRDTFVDLDNSGTTTAGDRIDYTYSFANLGSTTLFNIAAVPTLGTFATPGTLASLPAGQTSSNAFGTLSYTITAADLNNTCNCVNNRLAVTAFFNATGTNGSITLNSDDPDNFANNDANGDNLPDDVTRTLFTGNTGGGTNATDLFISEYIEGSSLNKAIEIANYTGATIDLSAYSLQKDTNGVGTWSGSIALSGMLATGQVYVIIKNGANTAITAQADLIAAGDAMDFNGNDPVGLFKNGVLLDVVGDFGYGGVIPFAVNETLVRKPTVTGPNTTYNRTAEWNVFATDDSTDLGMHTYGSTASVADSALNKLKLYPNPASRAFYINGLENDMTVRIYDIAGREIRFEKNHNAFTIENAGIYIIQVQRGNTFTSLKLIAD